MLRPLLSGLLTCGLAAATAADQADRAPVLVEWGALTTTDGTGSTGSFVDSFRVPVAPGPASIRLRSVAFDTYLEVIDPSGAEHANDDFGSDQNSGLDLVIGRAGVLEVRVLALDAGQVGPYLITVHGEGTAEQHGAEVDQHEQSVTLLDGSRLSGELLSGTIRIDGIFGVIDVSAEDLIEFRRTQGAQVWIERADGAQLAGRLLGGSLEIDTGLLGRRQIDAQRLARCTAGAEADATADGLWLHHGAQRIPAAWAPGDGLTLRTLHGQLTLPYAAIATILPPGPDAPLGMVITAGGSRFHGAVGDLSAHIAGGQVPLGSAIEVASVESRSGLLRLELHNGEVLVGRADDLSVMVDGQAQVVPGASIRRLVRGDDGQVLIEAQAGDHHLRLAGPLASSTWAITLPGGQHLSVDGGLVAAAERIAGQEAAIR